MENKTKFIKLEQVKAWVWQEALSLLKEQTVLMKKYSLGSHGCSTKQLHKGYGDTYFYSCLKRKLYMRPRGCHTK